MQLEDLVFSSELLDKTLKLLHPPDVLIFFFLVHKKNMGKRLDFLLEKIPFNGYCTLDLNFCKSTGKRKEEEKENDLKGCIKIRIC